MFKHEAWMKLAACLSIAAVAVVAYLPAVDNFFVSDDFVLLTFLKTINEQPLFLLEWPSEVFRVASYIYFWGLFQIFALNPEPYYWAGILLHVVVALLVCAVVLTATGRWLAAWAAGLFFAGYERHQEAVMWISAANDTILTLNFLVTLLLWSRYLKQTRARTLTLCATLSMFALTLFSKEGAVAFAPLAVVGFLLAGTSLRVALRRSMPLLLMTVVYGCIWVSQASDNFFVAKGLYSFGPQFFPVYARSLVRLTLPALIFGVPLLAFIWRENPGNRLLRVRGWFSELLRNRTVLYFAAFLVLCIVPYSFLTYQNHIPSRNTYLPSVGLAGIIGILFMALYAKMHSNRARFVSAAFLIAIVGLNVTYIWTKKEPQFQARSAPTLELIRAVNGSEVEQHLPITVCNFPLDPWIGREAILAFSRLELTDFTFRDACEDSVANALRWEEGRLSYAATFQAQAAQAKE
jgi:hypothetical protein